MTDREALFDQPKWARVLRLEIAARGVTVEQAAGEIGVSKTTLLRLMRTQLPNVEQYLRIERWTWSDPPDPDIEAAMARFHARLKELGR